jgi:hypothetical protein
MPYHSFFRIVSLFAFLFGAFAIAGAQNPPSLPPLRGYLSAHDPSTLTLCNGQYYQFWTGQGILSKSSANKVFWTPGPPVFSNAPAWTTNAVPGFAGVFWAPDLLYFNGTYHLYYAVSTFGSQVSAIGLATNPTLNPSNSNYRWSDQGPVITSTNGSPFNTIDPSLCWDNSGNLWMSFGSYWNGIYLTQLNPATGLRISPNSPTYQLAYNSSIEASYLWRRGGYYYLFVNWGSCCSGVNSTYNIRVGRSTSITGPYLDQNGVNMVDEGGNLFLQGNGKYTGPGQVGILDEGGVLSLTHHYYDANSYAPQYDAYGSPNFALLPLSWTADDWPVVNNDWSAIYSFQGDARDENGQYSGLQENDAGIVPDPTYGHVLDLNGTDQYVWLPPGVGYGETFAAVVKWSGGAEWQRIFDFGFDTTRTVMMTPASGDNVLRCDINPGGNLQTVQWTQPLPTNVWTQVAVTLDGTHGVLYVNGAAVVTNSSMNLLPLYVAPQTNHLGRSKFTNDPYFSGQYACFRSYGHALSPQEIVAPLPVIAQPADGSSYQPGALINFAGSAVDFMNRPLAAADFTWQISYAQYGQTNIVFGPVSEVTNGTYAVPATNTGGGNYIITLTAMDNSGNAASVSSTLNAANPPASWTAYYPLASDANDADGNFNGTLEGGAGFVNDPQRGSVLYLNGNNQFVSLPPGLAGMKTFMAWVKWNGGPAWQRIYDFGKNTNRYTILTPYNGDTGTFRFNISIDSIPGEQVVDAPAALPTNVWTQVAVVQNGTQVILYTNGIPLGTNQFANLLATDLNATNYYFGKSQWPADPYFNGELSSVRIFSVPLSANQILSPQITISQPAQGATYQPGATVAFTGSANDFYDASIAASGLTWTVNYIDEGVTNVVYGPVSGLTGASLTIPASGPQATNGFYQIQLSATDLIGRAATKIVDIYPVPATLSSNWASFYPFTSGAQDASNNFNGTLKNGAAIVNDPVRGDVLNLSPLPSEYVNLPAGAGNAQTVSGWVKWGGGDAWQRIFDFGRNTNNFFYLTAADDTGYPQCAITPDLAVYDQVIESPAAIPANQWVPFAVVMNGKEGILYLNGSAVAVNNSINLLPSDLVPSNVNLGKSEFPADPYFDGRLSDVRLSSAAVPFTQMLAPLPAIVEPSDLSLFVGGSPIDFSGTATDYTGAPLLANAFSWSGEFYSNGVAYAAFGPITGITNGSYVVPENVSNITNIFYRIYLTVTDTNGYKQSVSTDVLPQTSQLTLASVPPGLPLLLDGQVLNTPTMLAAVVGMSRQLSAPLQQTDSGANLSFVLWSDGGAATHDIFVPTTNAVLTASYVQPGIGIAASGAGTVSLSWPQWASALGVYSATNLAPPVSWSPVGGTLVNSNGLVILSVPLTNASSFYRLQSP